MDRAQDQRERETETETETDRQTDRQRHRQTDRQTDRQTETDRQRDREGVKCKQYAYSHWNFFCLFCTCTVIYVCMHTSVTEYGDELFKDLLFQDLFEGQS